MEDCQSAYQENGPIISKKQDILDAIDKKEVMCLVMLDLSATFDMVNHYLLLNRLKYRFGVCVWSCHGCKVILQAEPNL